MSDTPDNLLSQLSRRVESFLTATGISQRRLAKLIKTDETHLANFLAGRTGLSAEKSLKLMQILNASRSQLEAKLGKAATMQITHFQEKGKPMRLSNDGWVAGTGPDQNDGNIPDVNNNPARSVPDAAELEFLAELGGLHQKIIDRIDNWQAQQKARPNPNGSTGPGREISRPKTPGPRGDLI
jgi:transcriptional regulator with XRE-family HTH domain